METSTAIPHQFESSNALVSTVNQLLSRIDQLSATDPSYQHQARTTVNSLERMVSQASTQLYIAPYDQYSIQTKLNHYKALILAANHHSKNSHGFKFKASAAVVPLREFLDLTTLTDTTDKPVRVSTAAPAVSNLRPNSSHLIQHSEQSDLHIKQFHSQILLVLNSNKPVDACYVSNIHTNCVLVISAMIKGSVFVENLSDVVLVFLGSCHQLRIHNSHNVAIACVFISSNPIIEHSTSITVLDISDLMRASAMFSHLMFLNNKVRNVIDFDCLVGDSDHPRNWALAPPSQTGLLVQVLNQLIPVLASESIPPQLDLDLRRFCDLNIKSS